MTSNTKRALSGRVFHTKPCCFFLVHGVFMYVFVGACRDKQTTNRMEWNGMGEERIFL